MMETEGQEQEKPFDDEEDEQERGVIAANSSTSEEKQQQEQQQEQQDQTNHVKKKMKKKKSKKHSSSKSPKKSPKKSKKNKENPLTGLTSSTSSASQLPPLMLQPPLTASVSASASSHNSDGTALNRLEDEKQNYRRHHHSNNSNTNNNTDATNATHANATTSTTTNTTSSTTNNTTTVINIDATQQQAKEARRSEEQNNDNPLSGPGAFRVRVRRRLSALGGGGSNNNNNNSTSNRRQEETDQNNQQQQQQQQAEIPMAHVERAPQDQAQQRDEEECFETEEPLHHTKKKKGSTNTDNQFTFILAASFFGLLILGAIVTIIVLLRGSSDDDNNTNGSISRNSEFWDQDLTQKWDYNQYLYLYAVQLGWDVSQCPLAVLEHGIKLDCKDSSNIGIVDVKFFNGQGSEFTDVAENNGLYECIDNGDPISNNPDHIKTCSATDVAAVAEANERDQSTNAESTDRLPLLIRDKGTIVWIVGCASSREASGRLEVKAALPPHDETIGSCPSSTFITHALDMGTFCKEGEFSDSVDCTNGELLYAGESSEKAPFCGASGSCQDIFNAQEENTCSTLINVESLLVSTPFREECALAKQEGESFLDMMDLDQRWDLLLENGFLRRKFALKTHDVLKSIES